MNLTERIARILTDSGVRWKVRGTTTRKEPTSQTVEQTLDTLYDVLYDEDNNAQMMSGGILMMKTDGHYDVFTYIGEYKDDYTD